MVKIKPMEKIVMRQVRGSLEAFLDGKKNLNWIKGTIEKSGVLYYQGMLKDVFDGLRRYNTLSRYKEILEECKKDGWL
ncbi:MAG: hypothetical protein HXY46_14835 [Syntrophaceae bacterium]|nr:hypothetical protein [Syntrophaceae bacterium]